MYKIIDIHTHIYPEQIAAKATESLSSFYDFKVMGNGTYNELESDGARCGIRGFLLLGVATNAHQVCRVNDNIAKTVEISRSNGFITNGFGCMFQDYPKFENEIERMLSIGLCGIKIHPDIQRVNINDTRLLRLYEIAESKLPIYFHMGDCRAEYGYSKAIQLYEIMKKFPKLKVAAAHFGSYSEWENAKILAGMPNLMFDTSSTLHFIDKARALKLIDMLGVDNLMFGSDYPVIHPDIEVEHFLSLGLSDTDNEKILYYNAIRFLSECPNAITEQSCETEYHGKA